MDYMMQKVRKNTNFGGVQVYWWFIALPPVIRDEEWRTPAQREIFHSHAVQQSPPLYIELSTIYRQTDTEFISVLNNLRNNQITAADVQALKSLNLILI
jgi:hypothetical protein